MERGFKTRAERLALETRAAVGLDERQRLNPALLRAYLQVDLFQLGQLRGCCPDGVAHLHGDGRPDFSAAMVLGARGRVIVINERHSRERINNSICHELAHLLLDHPPSPGFDTWGNRDWRMEDEQQADWLAGCLLAPRSGLIPVMSACGFDLAHAAAHYEISHDLMRQRWHQTGAAAQAERGRRRRG